jgi:transposase
MGYSGAVSREATSGARVRRGPITKTGNAHLRRVVIEAAWSYRHRPNIGTTLAARQRGQSEAVKEIAWKAQCRLCHRYRKLIATGKTRQQAVTAIARELLGFIWAIGVHTEQALSPRAAAA